MQPVSTYSFLYTQTNIITDTTQLSEKLSNQLSSGKKAVDLADNSDHQQILDLTLTKTSREAYVKSCTLANITTSQYTISLKHLAQIASDSLKAVQGIQTTYTGLASVDPAVTPTATSEQIAAFRAFQTFGSTINNQMLDTTASLNEQSSSGDGYLYAGLRSTSGLPTYTLPPVRDLSTLPYFQAPSAAPNPASPIPAGYPAPPVVAGALAVDATTTAAGPNLPTYDADFSKAAPAAPLPTQLAQAWGTQKVTIADSQTVNLNFTSTDPAFQNLINGLRAAHTAADQSANYTTAERDQYLSLATSYLNRALNGGLDPTTNTWTKGIRDLEQQNTQHGLAIQTKQQLHTDNLSTLNTRLDSLIGIDTTAVTIQLSTVNQQLQASYKATATLLGLSLMNYLK